MDHDDHPLHSPPSGIRIHQPTAANRVYVHCSVCIKETYHDLSLTLRKTDNGPFLGEVADEHLYEIVQCRGCDSVSMIHRWGSGGAWAVQFHPSQISRRYPEWIDDLRKEEIGGKRGSEFANALREIYEAVSNRHYRLVAMGIRALLEQTMIEKVGDQNSFRRHLELFHQAGFLSLMQRDAVSAILDVGHAATHRFHQPEEDEIDTLLDVTEAVLATVFIHPHHSTQVADRVPKRVPRPKNDGHNKE